MTRLFGFTSSPASGTGTSPGASSAPPSAPTWPGVGRVRTGCTSWGRGPSLLLLRDPGGQVVVEVLGHETGQVPGVLPEGPGADELNAPAGQVVPVPVPLAHHGRVPPGVLGPAVQAGPRHAVLATAAVDVVGLRPAVVHGRGKLHRIGEHLLRPVHGRSLRALSRSSRASDSQPFDCSRYSAASRSPCARPYRAQASYVRRTFSLGRIDLMSMLPTIVRPMPSSLAIWVCVRPSQMPFRTNRCRPLRGPVVSLVSSAMPSSFQEGRSGHPGRSCEVVRGQLRGVRMRSWM